jgi:ubiquinone/menaquinone biosynthesis C-methylase UbiE
MEKMKPDQKTGSLFDEMVASEYESWYEQGFGLWAVRQEELLLHWQLRAFPEAQTLLEVGCGTGYFTRWFAHQGLHVTGLDESPAMLEQARRRNGQQYLQGDAQALPFEDHSFDLVALITTLEFISDPLQALREALRVARQGLLIGVLNRQSAMDRWQRMRGRQPVGVLAKAHRFSEREIGQLIQRAAGDRPMTLTWRTVIFPGRIPLGISRLPWGEYLGMMVRFGHMEGARS